MAPNDPSYFQSIPIRQEIQHKEVRFLLYMFQHWEGQRANQQIILQNRGHDLGNTLLVQDWDIRDGPSLGAKIVAHAQGLHFGASRKNDADSWFICFNMAFTDERFKASSLKVQGAFQDEPGEWAITGGTGEFAFAQGVVSYKTIKDSGGVNIRELNIRGVCLVLSPSPLPVSEKVHITKIGPWGGNRGREFDIAGSVPQHLESVTIRSGIVIDSIAFTYLDSTGEKKMLGPWGGDGELSNKINLDSLEIVKEVSGTIGTFDGDTVVTSLTLITNVRTYGPFGDKNGGTAFSVPLMDTNVVGFFVRAGSHVNSFGVYARMSVQS